LTQINISPWYSSLLKALVKEAVMSTYHVSFFKNLLSSDGHPFKCLQRRIDVTEAESPAQAAQSASRAFEALYGCPWKLHALSRNDGDVVGRIFQVHAAPVGSPWMGTLAFGHHKDRTPAHGHEATREAAIAAFAKSWRRE